MLPQTVHRGFEPGRTVFPPPEIEVEHRNQTLQPLAHPANIRWSLSTEQAAVEHTPLLVFDVPHSPDRPLQPRLVRADVHSKTGAAAQAAPAAHVAAIDVVQRTAGGLQVLGEGDVPEPAQLVGEERPP